MHDSAYLTPEGLAVGEWAVDVLQRFFGDDFLQRILDAGGQHQLLTNALGAALWPIVDGPSIYFDLFRLGAKVALAQASYAPLRAHIRNVKNPSNWMHSLAQLETAGLAARDGWHATFETRLGATYPVDVLLAKGARTLPLEINVVGIADVERSADAFFREITDAIMGIELRYHVHITGFVGDPAPEAVTSQWLQDIEVAAGATSTDSQERWVTGGADGKVRVSTAERQPGETHLEDALTSTDLWGRIELRIKVKAAQTTTASDQVWLYLLDHAGLWQLTPLAQMSLPDRFADLAPLLRQTIEPFPHVAGIVLTSGRVWAQSTMQDETYELPGFDGAGVVRRLLPTAHARETVIVARSGAPADNWLPFRDLYENEPTWLDWALAHLGKPPMDALLRDPH